jgi:hypothetical protein
MHDERSGLTFKAPKNWVRRIRQKPGIFRVAYGGADVSGWAYYRTEPLPQTDEQLATARDALIGQAKSRNSTFELSGSQITKVQGYPAIELSGTQEIFDKVIQTRSVHVFRGGEYVFEALAPPPYFKTANEKVLEPLLQSLEFGPLPGG